jgi:hypothetical protein
MSSKPSAAVEAKREKLPKQVSLVFPLVSQIFERAMTDADFRKLALTDPNKAITAVGGDALPSNVRLQFIDNSGETKTIPYVLPDPIPVDELSEADLAHVAGGATIDGDNNVITGCCLTV